MFILKTGYQHPIEALCFSPDGRYLATQGRTNTGPPCIQIWDLTKQEIAYDLLGEGYKFHQVIYTPDTRYLIVSAVWGGVWIVEIETGKTFHLVDTESECYVAFGRSNQLIVSMGAILRDPPSLKMWSIQNPLEPDLIWHVTNKSLANFHSQHILFTNDGESFLSLERRSIPAPSLQRLVLRKLSNGLIIREVCGLSPQKIFLNLRATHTGDEIMLIEENEIIFRNPDSKESIRNLRKPQGGRFVDFLPHPNGRAYVSLHRLRGGVNVWDATTLQVIRTYQWPVKKGTALAISPDGVLCAIGDSQGKVVVWDWEE